MAGLSPTVCTEKELPLKAVCNYIDIQSGLRFVYGKSEVNTLVHHNL